MFDDYFLPIYNRTKRSILHFCEVIMKAVISRFHSPLEKISSHRAKDMPVITSLDGLWGETVSFQISCEFSIEYYDDYYSKVSVECPGCDIAVFQVEDTPCTFPCGPESTGAYLTKIPALVPDILVPYQLEPVRLNNRLSRVFWVDVTIPKGNESTEILVKFCSRNDDLQHSASILLNIIPVCLPEQTIRHTEWFYGDCLCNQYGCEMFSDEFFSIAERYIRCAVAHGMDTLLTPVFTPSLDIEPFSRRLPGQLVHITSNDKGYSFDFSLLNRWVNMAKDCGIRFFEIAPFFTQWGAKFAAEIYLDTPSFSKTLFGWETPALSREYADFLKQFLPLLVKQLNLLGIKEHTYFHISDEPSLEHLENYKMARNMIVPYLDGCLVMDALSNYEFYGQDLVSIPVVAEDFLEPFLKEERKGELWTYSCCCQDRLVPNVFISMPSIRGRILGVLMYKENLNGFLRWGFNFWNSQFSKQAIDPYLVTDAELGFPSGDGFLVYPGKDGMPIPSLRLKNLRDAFQDHRALCALESRIGRQRVLSLVEEYLGNISFTQYPVEEQCFINFRQAINHCLKENNLLKEGK